MTVTEQYDKSLSEEQRKIIRRDPTEIGNRYVRKLYRQAKLTEAVKMLTESYESLSKEDVEQIVNEAAVHVGGGATLARSEVLIVAREITAETRRRSGRTGRPRRRKGHS